MDAMSTGSLLSYIRASDAEGMSAYIATALSERGVVPGPVRVCQQETSHMSAEVRTKKSMRAQAGGK